jgi:hypothetical protein
MARVERALELASLFSSTFWQSAFERMQKIRTLVGSFTRAKGEKFFFFITSIYGKKRVENPGIL